MLKIFIILLSLSFSLFSNLINAVAIKVNDSIITLYDIQTLVDENNISNNEAKEILINQIIKKNLIKKYHINISPLDIETRIQQIANSNNITVEELKRNLSQRFIDYNEYITKIKENMIDEKLFKHISSNKIIPPTDEELKIYYDSHIKLFTKVDSFDIIKYSANDKYLLKKFMMNPLMNLSSVDKQDMRIKSEMLNDELVSLLNGTDEKKFTKIINFGGMFLTFYVVEKHGEKVVKFQDVKNKIKYMIMQLKSRQLMDESFKRVKSDSNIKYIR